MIPSEKIDRRVRAPPENRLMMFRKPPDSAPRCRIPMSTTGTGTYEPSRKTAITHSVKRIFARRSGTRNALRNAFSMSLKGSSAEDFGGPSGRLDLLLRRLREGVRPHGQLLVELAASEDLDLRSLVRESMPVERVRGDVVVEIPAQHLDVHRRVR